MQLVAGHVPSGSPFTQVLNAVHCGPHIASMQLEYSVPISPEQLAFPQLA